MTVPAVGEIAPLDPKANPAIPDSNADAPTLRKKNRPDGVWKSNYWWCNCEPRKKAHILQVTKPTSPNKGRFYWKCAHRPYCNFFLWIDDAKVRQAALESASAAPERPAATRRRPSAAAAASAQKRRPGFTQKSLVQFGFTNAANANHAADQEAEGAEPEVERSAAETASDSSGPEEVTEVDVIMRGKYGGGPAQRPSQPSGSSAKGKAAALMTPGNNANNKAKRKRDVLSDDSSEEFGSLNSDEERQLTELTDRTVRESASKGAATTRGDGATPAEGSTVVGGLATPSVARTLFPQPESSKRQRTTVSFTDTPSSKTLSADATPKTGQKAVVAAAASAVETPNSAYSSTEDITEEIMALLEKEQSLDGPTRDQVSKLLKQTSTRTRMIAMGRDAARSALRDRDIKIGRLQERMANLENQQRMEVEKVANLKFGIMKVYDDN